MEERLPNLSTLTATLQRARERVRIGIWLAAANRGLTAALALFVGLEAVRRFAPGVWHGLLGDPATGAGVPIWSALLLGAAVTAIALLTTPAPSLQKLARRADRRFALDERLATALDIADRPAATGLLGQLLLGDAAAKAPQVDARALTPFKFTWPMTLVPLLALLAAGLLVLAPPAGLPPAPEPAATSTTPLLDSTERAALAADIERVAALVQAQADNRDDAYMQAVARTLQSLGERLANDPQTSHSDIVEELGALRDYAALAASDWRGAVGQRMPELLEALAARAEAAGQPPETTERPELPPNMLPQPGAPADPAPANSPAQASTDSATASDDLNAMLDAMEQGARGSAQPAAAAAQDGEAPRVSIDYYAAAREQNAQRSDEPAPDSAGAQLIGPSANAQAGDSLLAGLGTDATDGAAPAATDLAFETSDDLVLEANDSGGGRRIEMEIAPPAQLTEVTAAGLADGAASWARLPEAEVGRAFVGAQHRDMVSTYRLGLSGQGQ